MNNYAINHLISALYGNWALSSESMKPKEEYRKVDVLRTNENLVLGGQGLNTFKLLNLNDSDVIRRNDFTKNSLELPASKLAVLLLCGGISTRSNGKIHPLLPLPGKPKKTLIDLKLDILKNSALSDSRLLFLASPFNEKALREHLRDILDGKTRICYSQDLIPRLNLYQSNKNLVQIFKDEQGRYILNPPGHFDALRSLICKGVLSKLSGIKVVMIASYSNWGELFNESTLKIAYDLLKENSGNSTAFLTFELTEKPSSKKKGSALAYHIGEKKHPVLIKYDYGIGNPINPQGDMVLMSTNTVYIHLEKLINYLIKNCPLVDLPTSKKLFLERLSKIDAENPDQKVERLFDLSFPVPPRLSLKTTNEGVTLIQVERDLDQISLLKGEILTKYIVVEPERSCSVKNLEDLTLFS